MNMLRRYFRPSSRSRKSSGMALVITLSLIVLVTIAAMAFFARATANRSVESSRANQVLVSQLAKTSEAYVTGLFLSEMTNNASAFTVGGITVYQVTNAVGMVPARSLAQSSMATNTNFVNLIRQSVPGADINASTHSTATASRNGRFLTTQRWNSPRLNFGNGYVETNQLPNWIYINRDGSATPTPSTNAVGRFAYNVYETGGLLDANVAGHPGLTGSDLQAIKGTLAGADLTALGIPQSAITALVNFRNPQASSPAAYTNYVTGAAKSGFLSTVVTNGSSVGITTNNFFTSRQDLIRYAQTQNTGLTNALPFLTHASRSLTMPGWAPQTNAIGAKFQYKDNANNPSFPNRFFSNVRVKAPFTRRDGSMAVIGEPLIKDRFPLEKIAWIGNNGPVAPGNASTIQRDFGLVWDNTIKRWNYVGHSGAVVQTAIKNLDEVATDNREPNFFELLKAGILSGSIGKASEQKTLAATGFRIIEGNEDLQIARIGACLIDQVDSDNFPTHINLGSVTQHGVEDLPYLYGILTQERWRHDPWGQYPSDAAALTAAQAPGGAPFSLSLAFTWVPKLWNPHVSSSPVSAAPSAIRVRISEGQVVRIKHFAYNSSGSVANLDLNTPTNLPANSIEIPSSSFDLFRSSVRPPEGSFATSSLPSQLNWWNSNQSTGGDNYCGFVIHRVGPTTVTIQSLGGNPSGFFANVETAGAMVVLEYQDASGVWRIYDTLAGAADLPSVTGITTASFEWAYGVSAFWERAQNNVGSAAQFTAKWDPRTPRWGPCHGWGWAPTDPPQFSGNNGIRRNEPFSQAPSGDNPTLFGLWPQGRTNWNSSGNFTLVPGADNVFRPNDAFRGDNANPFRSMTDITRRPVILQRPFRSVGEMGYAFRDTPWQTLSFFDATSGDAALLDLFCVADGGSLSAGQVNLNTAPLPVLQAVLGGTARKPDGSDAISATGVATNFKAFLEAQNGDALFDRSQLAAFISSPEFASEATQILKGPREAAVRGLVDTAQTGTWNLTVDIVAQSGRFAPGATSADRFIVEGEERNWVHLALDRARARLTFRSVEKVAE